MKTPSQPARTVWMYAAAIAFVLGTWFGVELHQAGFAWPTLVSIASMRTLYDLAAPVVGGVLVHFITTGEWETPPLATAEPERPPAPQPAPLPPPPPLATGSGAVTSYTPPPFPPGTSVIGGMT